MVKKFYYEHEALAESMHKISLKSIQEEYNEQLVSRIAEYGHTHRMTSTPGAGIRFCAFKQCGYVEAR